MKEDIGFIALGQGGGNVVNLLKGEYETFFINTSREDLSTLDVSNKYLIPNAEGCNHNRDKAIGYAKTYYKVMLQQVGTIFSKQEFINVVFSAGGGTGSGVGPILVDMLIRAYPEKRIGACVIIPSVKESIKVQSNAYKCLCELTSLEGIGNVFVLDNEKADKFEVNARFVELFNSVIELPKYVTTKGNIDNAELKTILGTRGMAHIIKTKTDKTIYNSIIGEWDRDDSIFVAREQDKKVVYIALGLAGECDISNITRQVGVPYDTFTNYNDEGINIVMLAGLTFPESRMGEMKETIDAYKESVKTSVDNAKSHKLNYDLEFNVETQNRIERDNTDFEDIFKKY